MIKPTLTISRNHVGIGYEHEPEMGYLLVELRWRDIVHGGYFPRVNANPHEWRHR